MVNSFSGSCFCSIITRVLVIQVSEDVKDRRKTDRVVEERNRGSVSIALDGRKKRRLTGELVRIDRTYFQLSVRAHLAPTELMCQTQERTGGSLHRATCVQLGPGSKVKSFND